MNLFFRKLSVYVGILAVGCGAGFWGSRYLGDSKTVIESQKVYPTVVPTLSKNLPSLNAAANQNFNFIAQAVQKVGPAVVRIDAARQVETSGGDNRFSQPFFRRFFGDESSPIPDQVERGTGSGFILSSDGRLITNAHVVEGSKTVQVTLKDGQVYEGEVLGVDPITDVAVLKIEATDLPTVTLGNAEQLNPGEWAIAIGNPLGFDNTVTVGIISAIDRSSSQVGVPDKRVRFIQTDAAINPGNSGGPLLNAQGEVIGINTAIRADAQGLGFAIPIETARRIANQLFDQGKADHPYLGIHMVNLTPETKEQINQQQDLDVNITADQGVLIVKVVPNSPAAKAGLQAGDTILKVGDRDIQNSLQVQDRVENSEIGESLPLEILRNGKLRTIAVKPGVFPQEESS
ncbi:trypsin-like serine protease with C-terminal PDZ domain [Xenococcus sp. PCC 7305]|uniref:HhoA/HhoB/HtrA family serine endopeptidase n=1 Tax=Xenococcus sp. PCC 7305 TaxID=102125 RepID=UPI0002ABDE1F|nr:HhoA/HhoB/HtrA family serine endopeptidase [Xenococcus sp. PCC 7305]ELS02758.1 trypsin-like serine protease with C-terminal PDZ domain [Xenococcus sp. PCC 7305]